MTLIAIDNGHGKLTSGKRTPLFENGKQIHEWEFNYSTAHKLGKLLEYNGFDILYVSDTEKDTSLKDRTNKANNAKANLFASVHYNALKDIWRSGIGGIETYHHPNSVRGKEVAKLVHKHLMQETNINDRGVKSANFYVLRETKMASFLCECGFMDIKKEAELMLDEEYQWKCARGIAKGICEYYKIQYKELQINQSNNNSDTNKTNDDTVYKIQVGVYKDKDNAENTLNKLKEAGFEGFINEMEVKQKEEKPIEKPIKKEVKILEYKGLVKKGSKGGNVKELQNALNELGYICGITDGIAGSKTIMAIELFQGDYRIAIDGIAGQATYNKINELLSGKVDNKPINKSTQSANKSKYYKKGNVHIIETIPDNIEIKILGDTLHRAGVWGVNGTFFNTPKPQLAKSCWAIATNNGKAIGGNSMLNSYNKSIKRGTLVYYKDGTMDIVRVNSINEFKKPHMWSIGGYSVYPYMNFKEEKMPNGINYKTAHTFLGIKGNKIFLMVKPNCMIKDIIPLAKEMKLDKILCLDGGGSSQLRHPDGSFKTSRKINSAVLLKEE